MRGLPSLTSLVLSRRNPAVLFDDRKVGDVFLDVEEEEKMRIAAFGTIYGTLITVLDAFPRCFIRGIRVLKFEEIVAGVVTGEVVRNRRERVYVRIDYG